MSIDHVAYDLGKRLSIKEFKEFLSKKVKEILKEEYRNLEFKQDGKSSLWVICKEQGEGGCWFYFNKNSLCATTYFGRNGADLALQTIGVEELVKKYGGKVLSEDFVTSWIFNGESNKWEKETVEHRGSTKGE